MKIDTSGWLTLNVRCEADEYEKVEAAFRSTHQPFSHRRVLGGRNDFQISFGTAEQKAAFANKLEEAT